MEHIYYYLQRLSETSFGDKRKINEHKKRLLKRLVSHMREGIAMFVSASVCEMMMYVRWWVRECSGGHLHFLQGQKKSAMPT